MVTVDCSQGECGYVLEGEVPFEKHDLDIASMPEVNTKVCWQA